MSNSQTMAKDPSRTRMKKRKGHASVLHAADVRRVVNERVAANGPERVSLRGRALADADAVEAVCDAVLALGGVGQNSDDDAASPTVTLNLASGNVCGAGAARLAAFLLDPRCRVRELNLVDNPRLGVHLADIPDCPPAHAVEHTDEDKVVDGGGCEALARALQSPKCSLTQLNLGGCGVTCKGASALAKALSIDALDDRVAIKGRDEGDEGPFGEREKKGRDATKTKTPSPRLALIHLRSNDVGYAGVVDLAKAALRHGGIREVTLGNNAQVTRDALNELEEVLRKNRRSALANELRDACLPLSVPGEPEELNVVQTRSCSLRRRRLRDEDAATIAAALRPGSVADTLTQLDLSDNELTAFGIETLTHAIRGVAGNASLAFVSVAGNPGAHFDGGDAVRLETTRDANRLTVPSDANARFVEGSRSLSLTKTAPFSSAARALHGVVAVNFLTRAGRGEALKSVADRGLGDEGACEIAAVITQTATYARDARSWAFLLEAIGTQHNDIGARGAEALANALALLPNLKEWASYANPLGVAGARALARAVAAPGRFRSLEILDVGGCGVLDAGCVAIANAIVGHERLRELHLDHNEIGETGSLALLGSMTRTAESSSSAVVVGLRRVWLHGNPLVPDAVVARVHALASRTSALADARTGGGRSQFEPAPSLEPYEATCSFDARCRADAERLALRVYRTRSKHPTDANRRVDSSALFADRVAAYVTTTYRRRCPEHFAATRGAAVIAAVVAHETSRGFDSETPGGEDFLFVVSLGVGTKFMPGPVAAAAAAGGDDAWEKVVHDSHAEVLARRAFCRFLNREMRELVSAERAHAQNRVNPGWPTAAPDKKSADFAEPEKFRVLECTRDGRGFQVRANVTLHLYVSTAPCGAASAAETSVRSYERTGGKKEKKAEETRTLNANANADAVANTHSGPVLAPNFDPRAGSGFDPGAFLASTLPPAPRWASSLDSVFARDETAPTETRAKEASEPLEKKKRSIDDSPAGRRRVRPGRRRVRRRFSRTERPQTPYKRRLRRAQYVPPRDAQGNHAPRPGARRARAGVRHSSVSARRRGRSRRDARVQRQNRQVAGSRRAGRVFERSGSHARDVFLHRGRAQVRRGRVASRDVLSLRRVPARDVPAARAEALRRAAHGGEDRERRARRRDSRNRRVASPRVVHRRRAARRRGRQRRESDVVSSRVERHEARRAHGDGCRGRRSRARRLARVGVSRRLGDASSRSRETRHCGRRRKRHDVSSGKQPGA